MEKCYKISGRVQGVGFRYWAIRAAKHIGDISGYICNFSDGDVVAYVAGTEEELNAFYMVLHKGPLFGRVDSVTETPEYKSYFPPIEAGVLRRC
ncbi:MAG: acylphosphatase [Alphaproteobacteria bacterium]|nr:acylphosphatase [Alphaproteobacteria bacterium]